MRAGRATLPALLAAVACTTAVEAWKPSWRAPYADFDAEERDALERASKRLERGSPEGAWGVLMELAGADPDNILAGRLLQDVRLELLRAGSAVDPELPALEPGAAPEAVLRRYYSERVKDAPSVAGYVLAARLAEDPRGAEDLLDRALALDPSCAWAHYGRAHALLRQERRRQRWRDAREALDTALALEPGHFAARRLEAWMLAQEGETQEALRALRTWLVEARGDPRVRMAERIEVEVDLAAQLVRAGRPGEAVELLLALEGTEIARGRRLALLAVAHHELGDMDAALDAARRAEGAAGDSLLPLVQQAILFEHWLDAPEDARATWSTVVERAAGRPDLVAILQTLRARAALERLAPEADRDADRDGGKSELEERASDGEGSRR